MIHHLEKVCFPKDTWTIFDVFAVLSLPNIVRLKAVDEERLVGFIVGERNPPQNMAWIATFGVDPDYRDQGIGAALLETCEHQVRMPKIRLSVRRSNEHAIRLYKRVGYREVSTWPRYYRGGENALVMEKSVNSYQ